MKSEEGNQKDNEIRSGWTTFTLLSPNAAIAMCAALRMNKAQEKKGAHQSKNRTKNEGKNED